jgi:hypothetical protein
MSATSKSARRTKHESFGPPQREWYLPWDKNKISHQRHLRKKEAGFHRERASVRAATASSCRGIGTNATVVNRRAGRSCAAGTQPNVNAITGKIRSTARNMRRQNASAENDAERRFAPGKANVHLLRRLQAMMRPHARGHAVKRFLNIFAAGQVVTAPYVLPAVLRLVTAATSAAKRCTA